MKATPAALPPPGIEDLMGLHECAQVTGLQARTIQLYVFAGSIPSLKIGHARLFSRRAIREWLRARRHYKPKGSDR